MKLKVEGIWCPMATPLKKKGEVDLEVARNFVDFLIDGGVDGLFPLGTSGEFALLSDDERTEIQKAVIDQANGRVPVAVGVSDPCLEKVIQFSKKAKDFGADAVVATPPYYYTLSDESLYAFYRKLSEGIDLPLIAYNIPGFTHNFNTPAIVKRLADEQLIVGMK